MASLTDSRMRSVAWYFMMPDTTAGLTPSFRAAQVSRRAASTMYALPARVASFSCTPSNRPTGMPNCSRTRAYMPVAWALMTAAAADSEGSEIPRPAASALMSICQPWPARSWPPMRASSGTKTSQPRLGPFWKNCMAGTWRRPISTPGASVGTSATEMPMSCSPPRMRSGSYSLKASPSTVATGPSVM